MANEIAFLPECLFVTYDQVIKDYRGEMLRRLMIYYKESYRSFIDVDKLSSMDIAELSGIGISSTCENIFEYLALREFDYDKTLMDAYNKYPDLFIFSPLLKFGESIEVLLKQKFTHKIYIYTSDYDVRINMDISSTFQSDKVVYVTGDFCEAVKIIPEKITAFVLNDIRLVDELIAIDKIDATNILVGKLGKNYTIGEDDMLLLKIDDLEEKMLTEGFKVMSFTTDHEAKL